MNHKLILKIIGLIVLIEAAFLLLPVAVALIYNEKQVFDFLVVIGINVLIGVPLAMLKIKRKTMFAKDGFFVVALVWIIFSALGALPFVISGYIPNYIDALFETVSGFTTTGSSIMTDVEILPRCLTFWRCFTNWIGGMGILVFMLALTSLTGGSSVHLLRAESTGPTVEKMTPKLSTTAKRLYLIYIGITLLEIIFLSFDMPLFEAITTSIANAGTGGFAIYNSSIGGYSAYSQIVVTVFMFVFAVNFGIYFLILTGKLKQVLKNEELWVYLGIIFVAISTITVNIFSSGLFSSFGEALRHAAFQVATVMSTTGFATTDFNLWPELSKMLLVLLMFIGACAGSTAGGMKISRIIIGVKATIQDLKLTIHPRNVKSIRLNGKPVSEDIVNRTVKFILCYIIIFVVSVLIVSFDNFDFTTSFTAVAATLNNIGPGLGKVGPTGNFSEFSALSKIVMTLDMLIGRLEIYPIMILLMPRNWKAK